VKLRTTPGINEDTAAASLPYRRSALFLRPIRVIVIMAGDCPVIPFCFLRLFYSFPHCREASWQPMTFKSISMRQPF
jgi:hypothetical protein